ncbi:hypothetical protein CMI37_08430 [Candidatus Pacearchaeota archaeon]|nr:hypothetical protein [Candidatus Pacearchaeota archaeon]|tara:strand:+ start:17130 stop:17384 length:255 start_codon:yes stop_codon:yes gene_type:complete
MTEVAAWAGIVLLFIGNVTGWVIMIVRSSRSVSRREGVLDQTIKKLPCQKDDKYEQNLGSLVQAVQQNGKRLDRIEKVVNSRPD